MTEGGAELNIHKLAYTQTHTQPMLVSFWVDEETDICNECLQTVGWRKERGEKKEKKEQVLSSVSV